MDARARLAGVALVAALMGAGVGYVVRGPHATPTAVGPADAEVPADALARLQDRIARLEAEAARRPVGVGQAPAPEGPGPSLVQQQAQMQLQAERFRGGLEAAFASAARMARDDGVVSRVEAAFTVPAVTGASALPESESVECRATMCRVRATFAPGDDGAEWADRLLLELAEVLPSASVVEVPLPDGRTEVRIYAARPGDTTPADLLPRAR